MRRRLFLGAILASVLLSVGCGPGRARVLRTAEQLAATDTLGGVISSIDSTDQQIPALSGRQELEADQVKVVDVGRRLDDDGRQALDAAIDRNTQALADLRVALDNRPEIKQRLADYDMRLDNVIGVSADTPGPVVVYVRR